jgi:hypothetical protein
LGALLEEEEGPRSDKNLEYKFDSDSMEELYADDIDPDDESEGGAIEEISMVALAPKVTKKSVVAPRSSGGSALGTKATMSRSTVEAALSDSDDECKCSC